jgi:hypothetical protein
MEKKSHRVKHFGLLIYYAVVDLENRLRRGSTVGSKNLKMGRLGCLPFSFPPRKYVLGLYFADTKAKFYIGQTGNIDERSKDHKKGIRSMKGESMHPRILLAISILLAIAPSSCAQTKSPIQSSSSPPQTIWHFETGG